MEELKKKGHDIKIKGIVVHQVVKQAHSTKCTLHLAKHAISPKEREKVFVANIKEAYYKKSNPTYGIFGNNDTSFQNLLLKYHDKKEIDFFNFSIEASNLYKRKIKDISPATGGHLVFVHFSNTTENQEYMLVMTINNKDGFVIDDNLNIKDIKSLDLNKIDVACLINITKWNNITKGEDKESKTYLSFVRGNKDISLYFMSFIDCNDNKTSSESTKRLVNAIDKYCDEMGMDREASIRKKNEVYDYCLDCIKTKKEIQLSAISALFDIENPNGFMEFAAQEEYGVSEIISGDSTRIKKLRFTYYKGKDLTIIFDNAQLDKTVFYDKNKKQLTFKELPEDLINQLEK